MLAAQSLPEEIIDPIEEALSFHEGNARVTIATLLADCGHLRQQLRTAKACISRGFTRGWRRGIEKQDSIVALGDRSSAA
ncbi:hypothetical protein [Sinorhizobium glycinis]|uniref:hypothetical protein n=1 Tax=Sinorhizobium glycinis TaxID=1472378 RepID=UPI0009EEF05C|nr:hypothetical protein [Sinorhizobium glycinis]